MKIQRFNPQSFGSRQLYSAKLIKPDDSTGENKPVDVFVSEIEPSDKPLMEKIIGNWEQTAFGEKIINNFLKELKEPSPTTQGQKRFFAIERVMPDGEKDIHALAFAELIKNNVYLSYLQSESELKKDKAIKGLGSCLIYALTKLAQAKDKETITLRTAFSAWDFYNKLGFFAPFDNKPFDMIMRKDKWDDLATNMEQKYHLQKVNTFA